MIVLLLVTANDVARMALEGERRARARSRAETAGRRALVTHDVLLTLSLLLSAALAARFLASLLRVPEILVLVLFGALLGPSLLDVIDVPLDSIGAQLIFTLGVSLILFYGGLNLSLGRAAPGLGRARDARPPGGGPDRGDHRRRRPSRLRPVLDRGAADGGGALPHRPGDPDPAVRPLAAATEGRPDGGRRVGVQRPDRSGARARARRASWSVATARSRLRRSISSATSRSAP